MAVSVTKITGADYYLNATVNETVPTVETRSPAGYYTQPGNPPGRWFGRGAQSLRLTPGTQAGRQQVTRLIDLSQNPVTGRPLGDLDVQNDAGNAMTAGWDLTFTMPKSVSIMWAIGDEETRARIEQCHERAIMMSMDHFQDEYAVTRAGKSGVASVPCKGVTGIMFDHFDNRNRNPHRHTHAVFSNRVQRSSDNKWVALDGRPVFASTVEISELHTNLLADLLSREFGWSFRESHANQESRAVGLEIEGVSDRAISLFSSRDQEIRRLQHQLEQELQAKVGGRQLTHREIERCHRDAWYRTRAPKDRELADRSELLQRWPNDLKEAGLDPQRIIDDVNHAAHHTANCGPGDGAARLLIEEMADHPEHDGRTRADSALDDHIERTLHDNAGTRTTWKLTNMRASAHRLLRDVRCDPERRAQMAGRLADLAASQCVRLNPERYRLPEGAVGDPKLDAGHGVSIFDDWRQAVYTSRDVLDAEQELFAAFDDTGGNIPRLQPGQAEQWIDSNRHRFTHALGDDQRQAAIHALEHDRRISAIIGPAGTGKTTTMKAVTMAWQAEHGEHSVLGLATGTKAVRELSDSIGANCTTIAKLLYENQEGRPEQRAANHRFARTMSRKAATAGQRSQWRRTLAKQEAEEHSWRIQAGQLIIIDEAGMTDSRNLARITRLAADRGARLVMIGDPYQTTSVSGAGGMLAWAERHGRTVELTEGHRFTQQWEYALTLKVRKGVNRQAPDAKAQALDIAREYEHHGRLHWGDDDTCIDQAYRQCLQWQHEGRTTLLMAATNEQCRDINQRFILDRKANGMSTPDQRLRATLRDDIDVGAGDQIAARHNDWTILSEHGQRIENGMFLTVTHVTDTHIKASGPYGPDGSDTSFTIPRQWARGHLETGYATTAHRDQGATVDRAAGVISSVESLPTNLLYVMATRGRDENHLYIASASDADIHKDWQLREKSQERRQLCMNKMSDILMNLPDNLTASETRDQLVEDSLNITTLIKERDYAAGLIAGPHLYAILAKAHGHRFAAQVEHSPGWEQLRAVWSRAWTADRHQARNIAGWQIPAGHQPPTVTTLDPSQAAIVSTRQATSLIPEHLDNPQDTVSFRFTTVDWDPQADIIADNLTRMSITHTTRPVGTNEQEFTIAREHAPAVKAFIDLYATHVNGFDHTRFPDYDTLEHAANTINSKQSDTERDRRANLTQDKAAIIAARLNARILDRQQGAVRDDWIAGILPPITRSKNRHALSIVHQADQLLEHSAQHLEQEARNSTQHWARHVIEREGHDSTLLRDIAIYRNLWGIDDTNNPIGARPPANTARQEQHWTNLHHRLTGQGIGTVNSSRNKHTGISEPRNTNNTAIQPTHAPLHELHAAPKQVPTVELG